VVEKSASAPEEDAFGGEELGLPKRIGGMSAIA
jgi:hypothetical protein